MRKELPKPRAAAFPDPHSRPFAQLRPETADRYHRPCADDRSAGGLQASAAPLGRCPRVCYRLPHDTMSTPSSQPLTRPDFLAADVSRPPSASARLRLGAAAAAAATPADTNRAAGAYQSWNRGITIAISRALDATPIVSNTPHNSPLYTRATPLRCILARRLSVIYSRDASPLYTRATPLRYILARRLSVIYSTIAHCHTSYAPWWTRTLAYTFS